MSFLFLSIKNNRLFTPSILIFLAIILYIVSGLEFAEINYGYSYVLAFAIVILSLKVFTITFGNLENHLSKHKWFILIIDILLTIAQLSLAFLALDHLTKDKYLQSPIQWLFISNLVFYVQAFLAKLPNGLKVALIAAGIYGLFWGFLVLRLFDTNLEMYLYLLQATSIASFVIELILLFVITKYFVQADKIQNMLNPSKPK